MVEDIKKVIVTQAHSDVETAYAFDIVKNSKVVVFEWTLDINIPTKYVSSNIDQFGYTQDDFYSGDLKDFWQFVHPEDRQEVKHDVYQARLKGETFNHSYRILTKSGETRWVEERILYEKEYGKIIREKGILFDITDRKMLEEALERSKNRYQRIFENSSVIIFTISLNGEIGAINKMFERTLGYTSDIIGSSIENLLVHEEAHTIFLNFGDRPIDESLDLDIRCKDGKIKTLNVSTNIIDSIGEEIEIVAVDVSEKKKDEQKIRYLSYHDKLTGVYNRAYFDDFVESLDDNRRYPFSIIVGDMNGLKDLNDHYGHKKGDLLLKEMAKICLKSCRDTDVICRIGGDEFAIVCPDTDEDGARHLCERIRQLCLKTEVEYVGKPSIALGYSTKVDPAETIDKVFKTADNNMYRNKMTYSESSSGMYIKAFQLMLEKSCFEDHRHSEALKKIAMDIGVYLNLSSSDLDDLGVVAKLHDLGKIGVPDTLLNKPGPLTEEEYEIVKGHAYFGYSLLRATPSTIKISDYILHHHERYDGSGYPDGLVGEAIPMISRIIAVADAYVVMTNDAPYRRAMTHEAALEELILHSETQFDSKVVNAFIQVIQE